MQRRRKSTPSSYRVFSRFLEVALSTAIIGVIASSNPISAAPFRNATVPQSITPPCGVKVYMTASGSDSSSDPQNDAAVEASLETNTDLCVTVGVEYTNLASVAGTVTTTNYDVIYLQGQNNWYSSDLAAFGDNDLDVIENFLSAGGGLVIGEWHAWNECASRSTPAWIDFATLMPVVIRGNCLYGSSQNVRFYRWERPLSSLIDTGVAADFVFEPADYSGSLSFLNLKSGATPY